MKRERRIVEEVPMDCWCHIVSYLSCQNDFKALILATKGLLNYIKRLNRRCTSSVKFKLVSMPEGPVEYISNLVTSNCSNTRSGKCQNLEEYLQRVGKYERILDFFSDIGRFFPQVRILKLSLFRCIQDINQDVENLEIRNGNLQSIFSSLRKLELTISNRHLNIGRETLLGVEELSLTSVGSLVNFHRIPKEQDPEVHLLDVEWECFPKLKSLELKGWTIKGNLDSIRGRVKKLQLCQTKMSNERPGICDFEELEELSLGSTSVSNIKDLKNLPKIRNIRLVGECGMDIYSDRTERCYRIWISFPIKNFNELRRIRIHLAERILLRNGTSMTFENLPCLEEVDAYNFCFDCFFLRTPRILKLSFVDCGGFKVELKSPEDGLDLKSLKVSSTTIGGALLANIPFYRKLREIEIQDAFFETTRRISLKGFHDLVQADIWDGFIELDLIENCPSLTELNFSPVPGEKFRMYNVPKLENVCIWLTEVEEDEEEDFESSEEEEDEKVKKKRTTRDLFNHVMSQFRRLHRHHRRENVKLKNLQFVCDQDDLFSNLDLGGVVVKNNLKIHHGSKLVADGSQYGGLFESLTLQNFGDACVSNMERMKCFSWNFDPVTHTEPDLVVGNCGRLEKVVLGGFGGKVLSTLYLLNNPKCTKLVFESKFVGVKDMVIRNTPILKLKVTLSQGFGNEVDALSVDDFNFPELEELVVYDDRKEHGIRLSRIQGTKKLRRVRVYGDHRNHIKFVGEVVDVDLDVVQVSLRSVILEKMKKVGSEVMNTLSLREYLRRMEEGISLLS